MTTGLFLASTCPPETNGVWVAQHFALFSPVPPDFQGLLVKMWPQVTEFCEKWRREKKWSWAGEGRGPHNTNAKNKTKCAEPRKRNAHKGISDGVVSGGRGGFEVEGGLRSARSFPNPLPPSLSPSKRLWPTLANPILAKISS